MNEENIKNDDYIDLPPIKKIILQFLRFIFSIADLVVGVIKKYKLFLLAGLIAGMIGGFFYYKSKPAYFEVSMIAESSALRLKPIQEMIRSLNELIGSQSHRTLAAELGISEQQARQISYIELTGLQKDALDNDTSTKFNQPFKISAQIHNTDLTDTFQKAIVNYLDNKPLIKKNRDTQVRFYIEKLAFLDNQLAKMDTLETTYNHFLAASKITSNYFSNDADASNFYKQALLLMDEKGMTLNWLSLNSKPIQVIDEFKSPSLPQSYSRSKSLAIGALIGIGICFLLSLYLELDRKARNYKGKA
jgi:hypothetical protein